MSAAPDHPSDETRPVEFRSLDACHQRILEHLADFSTLVELLESQGVTPASQALAGRVESFFSSTAREHHAEEEALVFPPLLARAQADVVQAIRRLQQDHGFIEENWIELAPQLRALASGYHWFELETLEQGARVFIALLEDHIALEESLIYPRARELSAERSAQGIRRRVEAHAPGG